MRVLKRALASTSTSSASASSQSATRIISPRRFSTSPSSTNNSSSSSAPSTSQPPSDSTDPSSDNLTSSLDANPEASASTSSSASASRGGKGFGAWLAGEGAKYKNALPGRTNWIGDTPFPMNPTFAPLPPLADSIKTKIYNAYTHNILESGATDSLVVRAVSAKFGVGMDRVRAIVRLKELEKSWKDEGRPLELNLLQGMESHLGVKQPGEHWRGIEEPDAPVSHRAKTKTIFEMVDTENGDSAVFLPLLSRLPASASTSPREAPIKTSSEKDTVVPATRPGRPAMVFKDLTGTAEGVKLSKTRTPRARRSGRRRSVDGKKEEL